MSLDSDRHERLVKLEAENARLTAALAAATKRLTDIRDGRAFQPHLHAAAGLTELLAVMTAPAEGEGA